MVTFAGRLSEADFRRAQWLSSPSVIKWFGWVTLGAVAIVLATGGLAAILGDPVPSLIKLGATTIFALLVVIVPRRAITRVWRSTPLLHEPVEGTIDEGGIKWRTPSIDAFFTWDKVTKRRIAKDLVLLYTAANQALILPRSYFRNEVDWEGACNVVAHSAAAA